MQNYVVPIHDLRKSDLSIAGGKAANLGELTRINGVCVPAGFCVTTDAYHHAIEGHKDLQTMIEALSGMSIENRTEISAATLKIRKIIEHLQPAETLVGQIYSHLEKFPEAEAFAVRSSATAEDLPGASFAGQQDTYLNIIGRENIISYMLKCWASLYSERAVIYRMQNGFEQEKVKLAVLIQQMVMPLASGIMFTADPLTGNRKVTSIDAGFGLGEAMVSGQINPDVYKVREQEIIEKIIASKTKSIQPKENGGTREEFISIEHQQKQVLTDHLILELAVLGREIESHFAHPQDIEWCFAGDKFYIVQSRPITTLFPAPLTKEDHEHIYISVGHNQMMTDAMKPLGLSFFGTGTMDRAGGRLFIDVTNQFTTREGTEQLIERFGRTDELIKEALITIAERKGFRNPGTEPTGKEQTATDDHFASLSKKAKGNYSTDDVNEFILKSMSAVESLKEKIRTITPPELVDFILSDKERLMKSFFDSKNLGMITEAMDAYNRVNTNIATWLGEKNAANILSQSVSKNITSEMGMELLEVADLIRPVPALVAFLQSVNDENYLDRLPYIAGGEQAYTALTNFLGKYGMRCPGEIDITRPRWIEKPTMLIPILLSNIKNLEPGAGKLMFNKGLAEATNKEKELLMKLQQLPGGEEKAKQTKHDIDLIRYLSGYREFPKYLIVCHYQVYRQALLKVAAGLQQDGSVAGREDIYFLYVDELRELFKTGKANQNIIRKRKEEFELFEKLTPPRVITSFGEIITGTYKRENLPAGAMVGLPVSSGTIEGRARVIKDLSSDVELEEGDILVTTFTDPSWTPLFLSVKGLVTEVGGLMTHGAVIAREYGLPAVVGVEGATIKIRDKQRIRLNGTDGYVELISR